VNVGWVGLGKLGLTCSLTLHVHGGHKVTGYDVVERPRQVLTGKVTPPREAGIYDLLDQRDAEGFQVKNTVGEVVAESDLVFVAVQTPHALHYGGREPAPSKRRDFEYAYLTQTCRDVATAALAQCRHVTLVVVSTVLPGTTNRLIRPLLNEWVTLIYSPAFIAMGTTVADYRDPEFVVCGVDDPADAEALREVFAPLHGNDRLFVSDVETAELIKVAYNVFLSTKIVFANTLMEICHKTGADCDKVVDALSLATDRVISPKYLRGGMGDGGACHPRDLIAMSWLAERLDLSYDLLGQMAQAREAQTRWLADLARHHSDVAHLPIFVLGKAYKPESDLVYGSPAYLLVNELGAAVSDHFDPYTDYRPEDKPDSMEIKPSVVVIATKHPDFAGYRYHAGCVILDPFGYIPHQERSTVIHVGRKS
jgi:UDPglucose 6-dehydrogenase